MEQVGQFIRDILMTFLEKLHINFWCKNKYTAISRKVVEKSECDNPERYCGWFWAHCFSKKVERMAREAMDVCLQVLKESNKSRFDNHSVRNGVSVISYITFQDCSKYIFFWQPYRNSCIFNVTCLHDLFKIYQVSKEKVSTALSYEFTLLFSLTELGDDGVLRYGFLWLRAVMSNN